MLKFFQRASIAEFDSMMDLVQREPRFGHFKQIFRLNPALLKFVYSEKVRYPLIPGEERSMKPSPGLSALEKPKAEEFHDITLDVDRFHPRTFMPFAVKAIWLPIEDTTIYNVLDETQRCPLFKTIDGKQCVLFMIHPDSEQEYRGLLEKYQDKLQTIDVLSLSSFRTVLAAIPNERGDYDPIMVKLSLAKTLRKVPRLLSEQKCKLAVGNSAMLSKRLSRDEEKALSLTLMKDPLAILPKGFEHAGMIYRVLPDVLSIDKPNPNGVYLAPLLSLLSVENLPFFQRLVAASGMTVSVFLKKKLLYPVTNLIIKLLFLKDISLEIHAQNLGLMVDQKDQVCGLMYRDIEGINLLMDEDERQSCLPVPLRDKSIYFFDNHVKDSASVVEDHFVRCVLGPLTRQLAKSAEFQDSDPELKDWVDTVTQYGFIQNWTFADRTNDDFDANPDYQKYFRYGYVEKLFFDCLMEKLAEHQCFDEATMMELEAHFTQWEKNGERELFPPCTYNQFFSKVVKLLLNQPKPTELMQDVHPSQP